MIKLKELLNERYILKTSDTIEDVFKSAVESLEDLSDLFKKQTSMIFILETFLRKTND